jgi:hypothetical protein
LAKALAYRTEERYKNAGDFQLDLTKYLYSSYIDFSPRKLAGFIKEIFADELKEEQVRRAQLAAVESQTASMSIKEGAKQIDIVHKEMPPAAELTQATAEPVAEGAEITEKKVKEKAKKVVGKVEREIEREVKKVRGWPRTALTLLFLLGIGYGIYKYVPALHFWKRAPEIVTGIANIVSQPQGAKIFVDDEDTKLITPSELKELEVNKDYTLRLEKEGFKPTERAVKLASREPVDIKVELIPTTTGLVNIISDPSGAAILLNGKATGKITPATLEELPLKKDLTITLSKPKFKDFEQVLNLQSTSPQKISTVLEPITGSIYVSSNPSGAAIYLNKERTGKTTPDTLSDLKIGEEYTVRLSKKGYKSWSKSVEVADAKKIELEGKLSEEEKNEEPKSKAPTKPPTTRVEREEKPVREAPPPVRREERVPEEPVVTSGAPGKIRVSSSPSGAQVFVNAEYKGDTPLTVSVPPGTATVLINKEGYTRVSRKVTVKPGQSVNLSGIKLLGLYGEVSVASTPPRARVVFDNQPIPAKTPVTIRRVRRDQKHTISVSLPGYRTWSRSFSMESGDKSFNVLLERE